MSGVGAGEIVCVRSSPARRKAAQRRVASPARPEAKGRNFETLFNAGNVFARIGKQDLPEAFFDGNHVIATRHRHAWLRQVQLWLGYLSFYNPINFTRTLFKDLRNRHLRRRFKWQLAGGSMVPISILKTFPFALSLALRSVKKHETAPARCLPMVDANSGERVRWGIDGDIPYEVTHAPRDVSDPAKAERDLMPSIPTDN